MSRRSEWFTTSMGAAFDGSKDLQLMLDGLVSRVDVSVVTVALDSLDSVLPPNLAIYTRNLTAKLLPNAPACIKRSKFQIPRGENDAFRTPLSKPRMRRRSEIYMGRSALWQASGKRRCE